MRKILKVCRGVLEYLSVAEIVESMEELVTFVKNLTPGITEMAKKVEARIEELTHQVHADMLKKSITAVKAMSTQLITSIKTYVLTVQRGNKMNQYYCVIVMLHLVGLTSIHTCFKIEAECEFKNGLRNYVPFFLIYRRAKHGRSSRIQKFCCWKDVF